MTEAELREKITQVLDPPHSRWLSNSGATEEKCNELIDQITQAVKVDREAAVAEALNQAIKEVTKAINEMYEVYGE